MHQRLEQIINEIITAAHVNEEEKHVIEKELSSHMNEELRDLQLQGLTEDLAIKVIQQRFGDTEQIGQQFFAVKHRFDHIPWFGSLLSYPPLIISLKFFCIHLMVLFLWFSHAIVILLASIQSEYFNTYSTNSNGITSLLQSVNITGVGILVVFFFIIPLFQSWWLQKKVTTYKQFLEILILSCFPFVLLIIGYLFNQWLEGDTLLPTRSYESRGNYLIIIFYPITIFIFWSLLHESNKYSLFLNKIKKYLIKVICHY